MKKTLIIVTLLSLVIFNSVFAANFSDIENNWAKENINNLVNRGIINGYTDGTFRPNNNVTVGEAVKMLITSLGIEPTIEYSGHWATKYMFEAMDRKYIIGDELTDWNRPITRGELAVLIVRALDEEYEKNIDEFVKQIKDYRNIDDEIKEYVLKAYVKGIITGYTDGTFKPNNNITRAEAATMLVRFLEPNKRIVPELKQKPVVNNDTTFVEPELYVHYFEGKYDYSHFAISLKNPEDYENAVPHTFTTECISHPQINIVYAKDVYGKFMDKKINEVELQKKISPKFKGGNTIYELIAKTDWKPIQGTFNAKDGELMQYKVTVTNGKTTKEYIIDVRFNDREFY